MDPVTRAAGAVMIDLMVIVFGYALLVGVLVFLLERSGLFVSAALAVVPAYFVVRSIISASVRAANG